MAEIKAQLESIDKHLATAKLEGVKLASGCFASAARCRNSLLEIGKICSEVRKDVLDIGKSVKSAKRVLKDSKQPDKEEDVEPVNDVPSEVKASDVLEALRVHDSIAPVDAVIVAPVPVAEPVKKLRAPRAKNRSTFT